MTKRTKGSIRESARNLYAGLIADGWSPGDVYTLSRELVSLANVAYATALFTGHACQDLGQASAVAVRVKEGQRLAGFTLPKGKPGS
jgi:hypothetical protein